MKDLLPVYISCDIGDKDDLGWYLTFLQEDDPITNIFITSVIFHKVHYDDWLRQYLQIELDSISY